MYECCFDEHPGNRLRDGRSVTVRLHDRGALRHGSERRAADTRRRVTRWYGCNG